MEDGGAYERQAREGQAAPVLQPVGEGDDSPRHLADKAPTSELCEEYQIQPSLVYIWQRQAFDHLDAVFQEGRPARADVARATREQARVAALEAKLATKDAVIAEVSEEYLALKEKIGES